jgi:photosystem II stability/assembly factor-like uncharacterized protein
VNPVKKWRVALCAVALAVAVRPGPVASEEAWQDQSLGGGGQFKELCFADGNHGWGVDEDGRVQRTEDGGVTWRVLPSTGVDGEADVWFADATHGWLVGAGGAIFHTDDGGLVWRSQVSGVDSDLLDVWFADTVHGWVVGGEGVILGTQNGGQTWVQQVVNGLTTPVDLAAVTGVGPSRAWAVGQDGLVVHTEDGQTWATVPASDMPIAPGVTPVDSNLRAVAFASSANGWAVGSNGQVMRTTDGHRWEITHTQMGLNLTSVACVDTGRVWATGRLKQTGFLFESRDGGRAWTPHPLAGDVAPQVVTAAPDRGLWVAATMDAVFHATDGGRSWDRVHVSTGGANAFRGAAFASECCGCLVGDGGQIAVTKDCGYSWQDVPSGVSADLHAVAFAGPLFAVAVGDSGVVLVSRDTGATWQQAAGVAAANWRAVAFAAPRSVWIAGDHGTVITSVDAGVNWSTVAVPDTVDFGGMGFGDNGHGWIVGAGAESAGGGEVVDSAATDQGTIVLTDDAGVTWRRVVTGVKGLQSISFAGPDTGWGVTSEGAIVRTTDGGRSWIAQRSTGTPLRALHFTDGRHGWAAGRDVLFHTADGGANWSFATTPTVGKIEAVAFAGDRVGWFVGTEGFILRYEAYAGPTPVNELIGVVRPAAPCLAMNYPNPFNASTILRYWVGSEGPVRLTVYSAVGQVVSTLIEQTQTVGFHEVRFGGNELPSGTYLYELRAAESATFGRMSLLR